MTSWIKIVILLSLHHIFWTIVNNLAWLWTLECWSFKYNIILLLLLFKTQSKKLTKMWPKVKSIYINESIQSHKNESVLSWGLNTKLIYALSYLMLGWSPNMSDTSAGFTYTTFYFYQKKPQSQRIKTMMKCDVDRFNIMHTRKPGLIL